MISETDGFSPAVLDEDLYLDEHDYQSLQAALGRIRLFRDEFDFMDASKSGKIKGKGLPYDDQASLDRMHEIGFTLYRDPNVQAAIEVLISFVINRGWTYSMSRIQGQEMADTMFNRLREALLVTYKEVRVGDLRGWYFMQNETYKRYLRDGEFFRRWWVVGDTLEVRFIEVMDIRQPNDKQQIVGPVPAWISDMLAINEIPGDFGIISVPDDAATTVGFWHRIQPETHPDGAKYQFLSSKKVQHGKNGVDTNDPRGVPAFYDGTCLASSVNEVNGSMSELAIKQSKYAVVHKHRGSNRRQAIQDLTRRRAEEFNDAALHGRIPDEHHQKNVDIEMHGMKTNTRNYVEVIQQLQRLLGNLRQIPEFMITGDANTGNRSSLQSAESPFGRRVSREQETMWYFDQELLWKGIAGYLGWQDARIINARRKVEISPSRPMAETKDRHKDADMVMKLSSADKARPAIYSPQEAARQLGVNYRQMQDEKKEAGVPVGVIVEPKPEPVAGNKSSTQTPKQT